MIQTVEIKSCDMDETEDGKAKPGETVRLGINGQEFELELCARHRKTFTAMITGYMEHARRTHGASNAPTRKRTAARKEQLREIRAWAKRNGILVSERGRIPETIHAQYKASLTG